MDLDQVKAPMTVNPAFKWPVPLRYSALYFAELSRTNAFMMGLV